MSSIKGALEGATRGSRPSDVFKAWLGVADEVLKTVETTVQQARVVAEHAQTATRETRSNVRGLKHILRDALRGNR